MEKRELGRSGLKIAPLMFGGNVFGWTVDSPRAFALLDAFVDAGFDAIDTADSYSRWVPGNAGGESETIIGAWMKARGNRGKIVLATKGGSEMGPLKKGLSKAYIREAVEASLKRLQTDFIDLYQAHFDDPATPVEETVAAFAELIAAGKVRAVGASNFGPERLRQSLAASARLGLPRYETLQPRYNLYDRSDFEAELMPLCKAEGIGVISYYSLAAGFLTGKYRSAADLATSARGGRVKDYLNPRGLRILAALDRAAKEYDASPAAVSLAWLMMRPTIASATNPEHVQEFSAAARLKLRPETLAALSKASRPA